MTYIGVCHLFSAVYLSFVVSFVISVNDNDDPKRMARETARRAGKLLGGLALIALVVGILSLFG